DSYCKHSQSTHSHLETRLSFTYQAMEAQQSQVYEDLNCDTINKDHNVYELCQVPATKERRAEEPTEPRNIKKKNNKELTWNKPIVIIIIVLLSLVVILQVGILYLLLAQMSTRDTPCTCTTGATTANNQYPNFTQWANDIVNKVNQSLPDSNEWANGVSQNILQLFQNNTNFTELDEQILQTTRDSAQKLINIVNTLSNIQDTSTSTAGVVDDTFLFIRSRHLSQLYNSSFGFLTSCKQIKALLPTSPSGYYTLASANGSSYTAYCNMEELCGSGGGWTRLAYLDMSDSTENCPSGFRLYQSGGVRACGRATSSGGSCVSVQFPSNGISYSQVCGRVTGYQYGLPDAINVPISTYRTNINSYYVDGVSITRGSPRQHVWTLMAGFSDSLSSSYSCPCNTGSTVSVQSYIGSDYFCESGITGSTIYHTLYTSDPLWDGQACLSVASPCCNVPGIPWFHRDYGNTTTTDYIELRVCADERTSWEDTPVSYYEIYIK
uniref:Fibrinogen C-terminal domain-containing protein n=1 Tax=Amphimedon queenslandica TaxID=400682 RepID=A0A1X7VGI8_AMPQE